MVFKCDGDDPCERCLLSKEECTYEKARKTEKDHLRAEVERLKIEQYENNILIQSLVSDDTRQAVLEGLKQGTSRKLLVDSLSASGGLGQRPESTAQASHSVSEGNRSMKTVPAFMLIICSLRNLVHASALLLDKKH